MAIDARDSTKRFGRLALLMTASAVCVVVIVARITVRPTAALGQTSDKNGAAAFVEAARVFLHARCVNCHPSGDVPLQGDDSHPHAQNVKRGEDGRGKYALKCANCHQAENLPGENMPPGNPNWRLPSARMPLVFQGRTVKQLAEQLKDPDRNGGLTLEQLLHHIEEDSLVTGCWNPGDGRTKPPLAHAEFVRLMRIWVESGAPVPEE